MNKNYSLHLSSKYYHISVKAEFVTRTLLSDNEGLLSVKEEVNNYREI